MGSGVAKERRPPRQPKVADILFRDTITARMLRLLCLRHRIAKGSVEALDPGMTLVAFMAEYHLRCERAKPSRSSFACNFGRFDSRCARGDIGVIGREAYTSKRAPKSLRNQRLTSVCWTGPDLRVLIAHLDNAQLQAAFESMEAQMLNPRLTDPDGEHEAWCQRLKTEIERRQAWVGVVLQPSIA